MRLFLVGFKLSIGIEQYLSSIYSCLKEKKVEVKVIGDSKSMNRLGEISLTNSSSAFRMVFETLNPFIWIKFVYYQKKFKADFVIFVSSHTLNFITIFLLRLFTSSKIISVIHDPIPHSGSKFPKIILVSQYLQIILSHNVVVAGDFLKESLLSVYPIKESKVIIMPIGNNRKEIPKILNKTKREHFCTLGRIEDYKGIDIFLEAGLELLKEEKFKNIKFLVAGKGDLTKYEKIIRKYNPENLEILNYEVSDLEFDEAIKKSFAVALPYKDATQTCTIQIANSLSTPCIVSKSGSLKEIVLDKKTGEILETNSPEQLKKVFAQLISDEEYLKFLERNAYEYSTQNLQWENIVDNFIKNLQRIQMLEN